MSLSWQWLTAWRKQNPARVRAELLATVSKSIPEPNRRVGANARHGQVVSILASEGKWQELGEGVLLKLLHHGPGDRIATSLVRMPARYALLVTDNIGVEQFFVIEGDCSVAGQDAYARDYHRAEAGSIPRPHPQWMERCCC